jgi:large-conductance mechanosensitive channel
MKTFKTLLSAAAVSALAIGHIAPAAAGELSASDSFVASVLMPQLDVGSVTASNTPAVAGEAQDQFVAAVLVPHAAVSNVRGDDGAAGGDAAASFVNQVLIAK